MRVLFVCTGNTCRSPMAEGIMKHLLPDGWRGRIRVESAGTMGGGGFPPSDLAVRTCAARGIDIAEHASRGLTETIVADSDVILVMERRHLERVRALGGDEKACLLTDYPGSSGRGEEVPDPIGMERETYAEVFELLQGEISKIVRRLTGDKDGTTGSEGRGKG